MRFARLRRAHRQRPQHRPQGPGERLAARSDGDTSAAAVAAAARAGDPLAVASFERAAQALAAGIAATATLVEIDIAVIGGGVAGAGDVLFAPLRSALRHYATLSFVQQLAVAPAVMGNDAGLVGAAAAAFAVRTGTDGVVPV